jgi:agmatinase
VDRSVVTIPPTYATPASFLAIPRQDDQADYVVAGVQLDLGTTNRAGARDGPQAIRRASRMLVDGAHPHWWVNPLELPVADIGDFELALGDLQGSLAAIERQAAGLRHLIALGGEHGITLPLLRALRRRVGEPVALLHFDAHLDTWPDSFGQTYSHGNVFYHAIAEGLVDPKRMVQVGIRSPVDRPTWDWTLAQGVSIVSAQQVHAMGVDALVALIRGKMGTSPTYLSFDIDCLDPAAAPGTGTPEVGGLHSWQAQAVMRELKPIRFVGADVVEVAPAYDHAEITALAAATIAWEYLCMLGAP